MNSKFKVLSLLFLFATLLVFSSPEKSFASDISGVVNNDSVNIRAGAGLNYGIISHANKGDTFNVLTESNGWVKIGLPSGGAGWIADYLIDISIPAISLVNSLNVYQEASTRTAVIGALNKNDSVTILKAINGWYQIKSEKINGWVYGNLLKSNFTVSSSLVNVYEDASVRVSVKGTLTKGNTGQILKEINGWYFIKSGSIQGWIYSKHLTEGSPVSTVNTEKSAIVLPSELQVYKQETMRSSIIGTIHKNDSVKISQEINGWYQITSQTINGWVYGGLLNSSFSVSSSLVYIYQAASLRSSAINQLKKADTGEIIKEINGWYYIKSGTKEGWIFYKHLTDGSPAPLVSVMNEEAIVLNSNLSVYKEASMRTAIIGTFVKDQPVTIKKEINGWYQVVSTKLNGWVYGNLLKSNVTVTPANVDVYLNSTTRSTIVGTLGTNATIKIVKETNGWYYINSNGLNGWIYKTHLQTGSPVLKKLSAVVLTDSSLYYEPSSSSDIIGAVTANQVTSVTREVNGWYELVNANNERGWVPVSAVLIKQNSPTLPLSGKVIVLDAGHGGSDSGAIGPMYTTGIKTLEKNLTLQTVKLLAVKLNALGAKVVLTRSSDVYVSLEDRVTISKQNNADAFVSIHYNSSVASTVTGLENFYYHSWDIPLATAIHTSLINAINLPDRRVYYNDLHVLRENTRPSTLVELGFISNPLELALIKTQSYQDKATTAIKDGIMTFFGKK